MKESSGELSMTVVVIVGAVALAGLITFLFKDGGTISKSIDDWFSRNVGGANMPSTSTTTTTTTTTTES